MDEFVTTRTNITSEDLLDLERAIQGFPSNLRSGGNMSASDDARALVESRNGKDEVDPESVDICDRIGAPIPKGIEWDAIGAFTNIRLEDKEKNEAELRRKNKIDLRKFLDLQVEEANARRQEDRNENKTYGNNLKRQAELYELEKQANQRRIQEHHRHEKELFEQRLEEERKEKQAELLRRQQSEQAELDRIARALAVEQKQRQDKKEQEAEKHRQILKENEENNVRKALARQKDIEENERIRLEYAAKLDAEQRAREAAFQKRIENLEKFAKWADEEGPLRQQREEELKLEILLQNEQRAREQREKKREEEESAERSRRNRLMKSENLRQIEDRHAQREVDKANDSEYARLKMEDVGKYRKEVQDDRVSLKQKQKKYGITLINQIQAKKAENEAMNDNERKINKDSLNTIVHDPHFHSRVFHRLRIGSAR